MLKTRKHLLPVQNWQRNDHQEKIPTN